MVGHKIFSSTLKPFYLLVSLIEKGSMKFHLPEMYICIYKTKQELEVFIDSTDVEANIVDTLAEVFTLCEMSS